MKNLIFLIPFLFSLNLNAQVITTIAGGGLGGDGSMATAASIYSPNGVTLDKYGNIYIAESLGSKIRKVTNAGFIFTVAGNGTAGFNGDGIPATEAMLNNPSNAKVDSLGNIFIVDGGNNRVRKIDAATGIITTIAGTGVAGYSGDGGPATDAMLFSPFDLCFDNVGNLFVADYANFRVRKINTSGIISTVAGTGTMGDSGDGGPATAAQFIYLSGLAENSSGDLIISDWNAGRVRKINSMSGIITTIAGTGAITYNGDDLRATEANISPLAIAFNKANELYIVDNPNERIRKVDNAGIISTVAGDGISGFSGDGGQATAAQIDGPSGIAIDTCGNIFISQINNPRIRLVTFNAPPCTYLNVNLIDENKSLNCYPNPTYDLLNIDNLKTKSPYQLLNIVGTIMQQGTLNAGNNNLNMLEIPAGIYLLEIINDNQQKNIIKIVKL